MDDDNFSMIDPTKIEWRTEAQPVAYDDAMRQMEARVDAIVAGDAPDLIWLLEHPPLYTAGTSAVADDLKDTARFPVHATGRGGKYTYHGPGQRVVYVVIDLRKRDKDVRAHVWRLEEWMIRVLSEFGVRGERREGRVGIWVTPSFCPMTASPPSLTLPAGGREQGGNAAAISYEKKIGAIGVRVRKWVAYHGLALNVAPDLSHFSGIVPCGIAEYGVTSLRDLGVNATMRDVDAALKKTYLTIFT